MQYGQIHHIEYYVDDLERSNRFWSWFLPHMGYDKSQKFEGGISWFHPSKTYLVFVEVTLKSKHIRNDRQGAGLNHIAFMGKDVAHLKELKGQLEKRGIPILKFTETYLCFEDPNRFAVEVYAKG